MRFTVIGVMADRRIIDVTLDERTILWRSADVEQERRIAIFDLLEGNSFAPQRPAPDGYEGPYRLAISVEEGRLVLAIKREDDTPLETLIVGGLHAAFLVRVARARQVASSQRARDLRVFQETRMTVTTGGQPASQ